MCKTIHRKTSKERHNLINLFHKNPYWIEDVFFFNSRDTTHFKEKVFTTK